MKRLLQWLSNLRARIAARRQLSLLDALREEDAALKAHIIAMRRKRDRISKRITAIETEILKGAEA